MQLLSLCCLAPVLCVSVLYGVELLWQFCCAVLCMTGSVWFILGLGLGLGLFCVWVNVFWLLHSLASSVVLSCAWLAEGCFVHGWLLSDWHGWLMTCPVLCLAD